MRENKHFGTEKRKELMNQMMMLIRTNTCNEAMFMQKRKRQQTKGIPCTAGEIPDLFPGTAAVCLQLIWGPYMTNLFETLIRETAAARAWEMQTWLESNCLSLWVTFCVNGCVRECASEAASQEPKVQQRKRRSAEGCVFHMWWIN